VIAVDRSGWGRLQVTGGDRTRFLQGLTTVNVEALADGAHAWGAILNPKGRVLSVIDVARAGDAYVLACEAGLADKTRALLERYAVMDDVAFEPLTGPAYQRWYAPAGDWQPGTTDRGQTFSGRAAGGAWQWLRYRHLLPKPDRRTEVEKQLITNFLGYNTGDARPAAHPNVVTSAGDMDHWVGDLMLELTVQVQGNQGELVLELSEGPDRFQARFRLDNGQCSLWRLSPGGPAEGVPVGETKDTRLRSGGEYTLRFANFDDRLTVWVDGGLPFGDGEPYTPPPQKDFGNVPPKPTPENDLERPASVGLRGGAAVTVSNLRLWRDTYYTDHPPNGNGTVETLYVQPGHYLAMGDNSSESSDSRYWGAVPERLLLGRALVVYWPYNRVGLIK
jgi:hypothetical protein